MEVGLQTGELDPLQSTKTSVATAGLLGRVVTVVEFQARSSKIRYCEFVNSSFFNSAPKHIQDVYEVEI